LPFSFLQLQVSGRFRAVHTMLSFLSIELGCEFALRL
jgi:hypothetical protein